MSIVKHIGIVSCYGFGNVGDDSYGYILKKFFSDETEYKLYFIHDNLVYLKNNTYIPIDVYNKEPSAYEIFKPDYIIIGGGGLFDKERLDRGTSIQLYSSLCKQYNIPYYILSVGFQFCEVYANCDNIKALFTPYKEIFEGAEYISIRTIIDYTYLRIIMDSCHYYKIEYNPDLVYSINKFIDNSIYIKKDIKKDIILVTMCKSWINLEYDHINNYINSIISEHPEFKIIFIDFDGYNPDRNIIIDPDNILMYYSNAEYIYGKKLELDMSILLNNNIFDTYSMTNINNRYHTLEEIIQILHRTHTLITGRFHGLVLGKVIDIPNIYTVGYNNYKFRADYLSNHIDMPIDVLENLSLKPLHIIKKYIDTNYTTDAYKWSDNTRNTNINTVNKLSNIDISLIQNWYNNDIEYYLQNKKLKFD